ncbi:MAG: AAA family ATPase [Clostridiales bacterium]|nr:AAA family ATPase [Clostridiales bacterium]
MLIDEYDSPFNHKQQDSIRETLMADMSTFFGAVFKGHDDVILIAVTGCLRISNESVSHRRQQSDGL